MRFVDVELNPDMTPSLDAITSFEMESDNGTRYTFEPGDKIVMDYPDGSTVVYGVVGMFFGVGRLRGVRINSTSVGREDFTSANRRTKPTGSVSNPSREKER